MSRDCGIAKQVAQWFPFGWIWAFFSLIGISEENINLLGEVIGAMAACRDYHTNKMNIVLHDKYIQVSRQESQYVLAFIILDRSHGVFQILSNL